MTRSETQPLELEIGHAVPGGRCLARHEGKVVLVAGALPGERVVARITRSTARHAEAETVDVLQAHARRRVPPCPHAGECGGCDFQHAERDLQLEMKHSMVVDAFRRIGRLDVSDLLDGPHAVGAEFGSRNRIRLTADADGRPGLLRRGSHDAVAITDCMQLPPAFGERVLPSLGLREPGERVTVRIDSEERTAVYSRASGGSSAEGPRSLRFRVAGAALTADPAAFFQVSLAGAEELVRVVREMIGDDRRGLLLDLYAGVGLLAACCGGGFERVVAGDSNRRAFRHLGRNLRRNGVRAGVACEPSEVTLRRVPRDSRETVIVDPPREGLDRAVRRALISRRPRRIVSVSCDPATGARDVGELARNGWGLERIAAIDMFPVTAHVETVALLARSD
jgi:tRNA/tmRNA/rRNA uracil-C5-methylase (TrmA/RlmC/RlmD family)